MGKINILSTETANKISAGEVVERPYSVVKELIENSLDAGSKNIIIEIEEGGQKYIKISDDGVGIMPDDIEKAFLPHATSKISKVEDIYSINTMGFRGEALASIASVSDVTLKSKTNTNTFGKEINIQAGKIEYMRDTGCNDGTIIEVKNLFYNVPARQKFLKSTQSESTAISDIIGRLSIAHPDVCFKYINNGKNVLTTYGGGDIIETIRCIYGKNICENIINFESHGDIASVYGYIGNAEVSRGSRNNQSIFVNKRYIKNKLITAAVENAFKSFLTVNKFPFFIVFIDIYPEFIDVNVHPTKLEIKFREDRQIFKLVFDTVHNSLKDYYSKSFDYLSDNIIGNTGKIQEPSNSLIESRINVENDGYVNENAINENTMISNVQLPIDLKYNNIYEYKSGKIVNNNNINPNVPKFPEMRLIGQYNKTYIIAEANFELYMIDQHAAHEKILFEKYTKNIREGKVVSQVLISPYVVEMDNDDYNCFDLNIDVFKNAGFEFDKFGDKTISIRGVPLFLGKPDLKSLLFDILDNLKNMGSGETSKVKYDKIAKLACKSAIKGHDLLTNDEMLSLLNELRLIDNPFTCPHGRPTIIKFTLNEIEKRFKRIQ